MKSNFFRLELSKSDQSTTTFVIKDSKGILIQTINKNNRIEHLNVSNLAHGIYVITGVDSNNQIKYQQRWTKL